MPLSFLFSPPPPHPPPHPSPSPLPPPLPPTPPPTPFASLALSATERRRTESQRFNSGPQVTSRHSDIIVIPVFRSHRETVSPGPTAAVAMKPCARLSGLCGLAAFLAGLVAIISLPATHASDDRGPQLGTCATWRWGCGKDATCNDDDNVVGCICNDKTLTYNYDTMTCDALGGTAVEAALGGTAVEAALGGTAVEAALGGTAVEAALGGTAVEAALGGTAVEAALGGTAVEAALGGTAVEAALGGTAVEAALGGTAVEAALGGTAVEAALGGTAVEAALGGTAVEAALGGTAVEAALGWEALLSRQCWEALLSRQRLEPTTCHRLNGRSAPLVRTAVQIKGLRSPLMILTFSTPLAPSPLSALFLSFPLLSPLAPLVRTTVQIKGLLSPLMNITFSTDGPAEQQASGTTACSNVGQKIYSETDITVVWNATNPAANPTSNPNSPSLQDAAAGAAMCKSLLFYSGLWCEEDVELTLARPRPVKRGRTTAYPVTKKYIKDIYLVQSVGCEITTCHKDCGAAECVVKDGQQQCQCPEGFVFNATKKTCRAPPPRSQVQACLHW
ncbi:unnamed protein product [Closterium sp. NIES-64]|nr:unnamed protein product [Closterium sp. NIES-64]